MVGDVDVMVKEDFMWQFLRPPSLKNGKIISMLASDSVNSTASTIVLAWMKKPWLCIAICLTECVDLHFVRSKDRCISSIDACVSLTQGYDQPFFVSQSLLDPYMLPLWLPVCVVKKLSIRAGRYGLKIESPIFSHQTRFTILIDFFFSSRTNFRLQRNYACHCKLCSFKLT